MKPLPDNAKPILDARLRGLKPEDMVIVSPVGPVKVQNHVVRADPWTAYDWRWAHGLDICVYIDQQSDWIGMVKDIALQRPAHLCVWCPEGQWGATVYLIPTAEDICKPVRQRGYELDFLPWMDFQNDDFIACRTYTRSPEGMPHACDS